MATLPPLSLEFLPNIRQLVLFIPINLTDFSSAEITAKIFLNRKTKQLHTGEQSNGESDLLISVPGRIDLQVFDLPIAGNEVENFPQMNRIDNVLILQFRNVNLDCPPGCLQGLVTAKILQSDCTSLSCSTCASVLKHFNPDEFTFKDLPNEHWLELLDCWSCHDNEFAPIAERALNQKLPTTGHDSCAGHQEQQSKSYQEMNNAKHGLILPPPNKIYIGTSYILMNQHDFDASNCPHCQAHLAEPVQKGHIKIYRDAVRFDGSQQFMPESFSTILMHAILDTIDNHSTFHFILKAAGREKLYLRPINWDLSIYDRNLEKWRSAFKVGYTQMTGPANTEAEIIHCTLKQYDQILKSLDKSHYEALFGSTIKMPGSSETLKLSYLIN